MIRNATIKDAQAIAIVHIASWHESYTGIIPDSYLVQLDLSTKQEMWEKVLERNQAVFVAESGGQIVGFGNGGRNRNKESEYPGELYTLYLLKQFHGLGIGKELFNHVRQHLKENGLFPFTTFVLIDNPALSFYKHLGAEAISEGFEDYDRIKLKKLQLLWQ